MSRRTPRWIAALLLGATVLGPRPSRADDIDEATTRKAVEAALAKAPDDDLSAMWALAKDLAKDKAAVPALRALVETVSPGKRLAIGRALVLLHDELKGVEILEALAGDEKAVPAFRVAALKILEREGDVEQAEWLFETIDGTLEPSVKMGMARALWRLGGSKKGKAKEVMLEYLKSEDRARREEGALALGEIGAAVEAKPVLAEMRGEPTERGRSAAFLLDLLARETLAEAALRAPPPAVPGPGTPSVSAVPGTPWPLLDEIRHLLEQYYVDLDKVRDAKLEDAAAKGFTEALDEHSAYMSPTEYAKLLEGLDPTYGGVGAYVAMDADSGGRFTVSRPIWGGPLYRARIRSGDVVVAIDGEPTLSQSLEECVRRLKGPAGTKVVLSVMRAGWTEKQDFTLTRANITIPSTAYDVLPGGIGYLALFSFGEDSAREIRRVLDEFAAAGVRALVLDLRGNGGGLLRAAVDIASEFLPAGVRVVSEKGRDNVWPERVHVATGSGASRPAWPVVVLTNGGTASASEILSGALRHHGRARLVGTQTFGKGSVQVPLDLKSRPGEPYTDAERVTIVNYADANGNGRFDEGEPARKASLRNGRYDTAEKFTDADGNGVWDDGEAYVDANQNGVYDPAEAFEDLNKNGRWDTGGAFKPTVAKYFLPDGTNLKGHTEILKGKVLRTGGLVPDIEVKDDVRDFWELQAQTELYRAGAVKTYVDEAVANDPTRFEALARSDRRDPASYPGFDAWYEGLGTKLSKQAVRAIVRLRVREELSDRLGRALDGDVVDDATLRTGVLDLLTQLKVDPRSIEDLAFLADLPKPKANADKPTDKPGDDAPETR